MDPNALPPERRAGLSLVPAATLTCALLTAWTVLSAVFPAHELVTPCLRSLYTATLYVCFVVIRKRTSLGRALAFRLVEIGFLLLTACFATSAVVRVFGHEADPEAVARTLMALEQGPGFLLGVSLLSYGIVLLIAELLVRQARLQRVYATTKGELLSSEHARRAMEQRLLEAEALRAVGELAAGVAHDLRNPLAVVKAAVEGFDQTTDAHRERIAVIARNLARADATIEALLDVGRTKPAARAPVVLDEILADAVEIVLPLAEQRSVRVQPERAAGTTLAVERAATQRALVNLLTNAIEASDTGREVLVRIRRSSLHAGRVWLAIEDRGTGLPLQRSRLFRPFFTTKKHGTGLGLLSARRILSAMGGQVRLYPRRRGGARALLCVPTTSAGATVSEPVGTTALAGSTT